MIGSPGEALGILRGHCRGLGQPGQIVISTITPAELEWGVARSRERNRNRIALLEFLLPFTILDFDQKASMEYGRIRSSLESRGTPAVARWICWWRRFGLRPWIEVRSDVIGDCGMRMGSGSR